MLLREKEKGTLLPVLVEPGRGVPSLALQLQMGVFEEGPSRTPGMHWVSFPIKKTACGLSDFSFANLVSGCFQQN